MKVVFLDVDGVLNGHEWIHRREGARINPEPARNVHLLLKYTKAKVVISSTWRSWVNRGSMTAVGFSNMLETHGINADVIDVLPRGHVEERATQILAWVAEHKPSKYVVLDDLPLVGVPLIRCDPGFGFRPFQISEAVKILDIPVAFA